MMFNSHHPQHQPTAPQMPHHLPNTNHKLNPTAPSFVFGAPRQQPYAQRTLTPPPTPKIPWQPTQAKAASGARKLMGGVWHEGPCGQLLLVTEQKLTRLSVDNATSSPLSDEETVVGSSEIQPVSTLVKFDAVDLMWLDLVVMLRLRALVDELVKQYESIVARTRDCYFDIRQDRGSGGMNEGLGEEFSIVQETLMEEEQALRGWGKAVKIATEALDATPSDGMPSYHGMNLWVESCIVEDGKMPAKVAALVKICCWMRSGRVVGDTVRRSVKVAIEQVHREYMASPDLNNAMFRQVTGVAEASAEELGQWTLMPGRGRTQGRRRSM